MTEREVPDPDAITVEEASVIAGIPVSAVRRYRREGFFSRLAGYPCTTPNAREFGFQIESEVGSREFQDQDWRGSLWRTCMCDRLSSTLSTHISREVNVRVKLRPRSRGGPHVSDTVPFGGREFTVRRSGAKGLPVDSWE